MAIPLVFDTLLIMRMFKLLLPGIILMILSGCSKDFHEFWGDPAYRTSDIKPSYQGATARFFGVSSFLINDGNATIMIDGYFSRPQNFLLRPIAPLPRQVERILCSVGVMLNEGCASTTFHKNNLDAVFAMHGHFDHAMDSAFVACVTGATVFGGPVTKEIVDRTERFFPDRCKKISYVQLDENLRQYSIDYDPISVTLVRVPHSANIASKILENATYDPDWSFPAKASQMKEGISVAAHLKLRYGSILIVPTAGDINDEFSDERFIADTVFLGIGALGFANEEIAKKYWDNTVIASKASWVVPIHWDTLSGPINPEAPTLDIPFYERIDRVLGWFQKFAANEPDIVLRPIPVFKPFNPFFEPSQ